MTGGLGDRGPGDRGFPHFTVLTARLALSVIPRSRMPSHGYHVRVPTCCHVPAPSCCRVHVPHHVARCTWPSLVSHLNPHVECPPLSSCLGGLISHSPLSSIVYSFRYILSISCQHPALVAEGSLGLPGTVQGGRHLPEPTPRGGGEGVLLPLEPYGPTRRLWPAHGVYLVL